MVYHYANYDSFEKCDDGTRYRIFFDYLYFKFVEFNYPTYEDCE